MAARSNAPEPLPVGRPIRGGQDGFTTLPKTGLQDVPPWPETIEEPPSMHELAMWNEMWRERPQAHIWAACGMHLLVASYVRTAHRAVEAFPRPPQVMAFMRVSAALMLTPDSLRSARYRIDVQPESVDMDGPVAPVVGINKNRRRTALERLRDDDDA